MSKAYKYPSTNQFRQVIRTMISKLTFDGLDENGQAKYKPLTPDAALIEYTGTVKVHGTNGSVVFLSETEYQFQSKERIVVPGDDNHGFAAFMSRKDMNSLLNQVRWICEVESIPFAYPSEIAGEWAGRGIQSGVAVAEVEPFFVIFRIGIGRDESGFNWLPPASMFGIGHAEQRIYNVLDFGFYRANIPFDAPEMVQNDLGALTLDVERSCPAGRFFGVEGIGEGLVWSPTDPRLAKDSGLWFKVKGEKHSVSKVKTLAAVNPEKLASIQEFVAYAVTEARLEQGAQEVGVDLSKTGEFLAWMARDINKEEGDVMEVSCLTMKDVGKFISNKARGWYMQKVQEISDV